MSTFVDDTSYEIAPSSADHPVSVTVCGDGPLLVRGAASVTGPDGDTIIPHRRTFALCRCGSSAIKPWCDGTHKLVRRSAPTA